MLYYSIGFASAKTVEVEFKFFNTGIASASLYMNGSQVCIDQPLDRTRQQYQEYKFVCASIDIVPGTHIFTMTGTLFGEETLESNAFTFSIDLLIMENFKVSK